MALTDDKCTFYVPAILETTRPGYHRPPIEFLGFPKNEKLCKISPLNVYLTKTETVRKSKQLFVSSKASHNAVKTTKVGRWCMETKKDAGIEVTVSTSHSMRSSSTRKSRIKGLSLTMINKSAGWTTGSTFAKFYNKPVHENFGTFAINTEQT